MRWFKHMSDLSKDEGVSRYLDAAGRDRVLAYGFLMFVLEAIASRMDWRRGDRTCSASYSTSQWERITYSHANRVTKYLRMCEVIGWVQVEFEGSSCRVTVPKMVQWRDEYSRKSGQAPANVAQKRVEKNRTEEKESRGDDSLSESLASKSASRTPPLDFNITPESRQWAKTNYPNVDIDKETEKFRLYEFPTPKSNWDAAWRSWIVRAAEYQHRRNGSADQPSHNEQLLTLGKELGVQKQPDEADADYCIRVDAINQRRIANLDS